MLSRLIHQTVDPAKTPQTNRALVWVVAFAPSGSKDAIKPNAATIVAGLMIARENVVMKSLARVSMEVVCSLLSVQLRKVTTPNIKTMNPLTTFKTF